MAKQDVLDFWKKVSEDPELARKLETSVAPEGGWDAVVSFAGGNGFSFTTEDYAEAVKSLPKQLGAEGFQAWKKGETLELGDEELEQVAGGIGIAGIASISQISHPALAFDSRLRSILQPWGGIGINIKGAL